MRRRLLFVAVCLPALIVLQLKANVDPVQLEIAGPGAAMVGQKVTFSASATGGSGSYTYQWAIDGQSQGTGQNKEYTVPSGDSNAKKVTVTCTVTDSQGQSKAADMDFWQISLYAPQDQTCIESEDSQDFTVVILPNNAPCDNITWRWEAAYSPNGHTPRVEFTQQNQRTTRVTKSHWYAFPNHRLNANVHSYYNIYCDVTVAGVQFQQRDPTRWIVTVGHTVVGGRIVFGVCEWRLVAGLPEVAKQNGQWRVVGKGTMYRMYPQPRVYMPYASDFHAKFQAHENYHNTQFTSIYPWNTTFLVDTAYQRVVNLTAATKNELLDKAATAIENYNRECKTYVIPDNETAFERPAYAISNNLEPDYLENDNYN